MVFTTILVRQYNVLNPRKRMSLREKLLDGVIEAGRQ